MRVRCFYVCAVFLVFLFSVGWARAETVKLRVKVTTANIRLDPDLESRIIGKVHAGTILESDERIGDWFKVAFQPGQDETSIIGHIHVSTIEILAGPADIAEVVPIEAVSEEAAPVMEPAVPSAETSAPQGPGRRIAVRFTGGLGYLDGGDTSANRTSYSAYMRDRERQPGSGISVEGETESIHTGTNWEAEVVYELNSRLDIGFGVGYIHAGKDKGQSRIVSQWSGRVVTVDRGTSLSAVPVKLGVFYSLLKGGRFHVVVNAGAAYYLATWQESMDFLSEAPGSSYWAKYVTKTHGGGIGFHGGLGLEYRLSRNMALVVDGIGRYARFGGFEGEYSEKNSSGADVTMPGKLYYYEWSFDNNTYPWLELFDRDPNQINFSDPVKNIRDAVLDFSGFSLRVGIKISL
ncbi:MAG: SH3 domain-containing protein [Acidobacteriota bacterium]|nr:SH3 domain-containing protein [Acidobacteriota bacterium]